MDRATGRGRSPHGERGLKYDWSDYQPDGEGRSPHGERGLKCHQAAERRIDGVALLMESVD